jgi:hypothetical protein
LKSSTPLLKHFELPTLGFRATVVPEELRGPSVK